MKHRLIRFIARHRTGYSVAGVLLYIVILFPATVILFPDSNMWLGMIVLLVGLLDEVKDLADQVIGDDESDGRQNR